MEDWIVDWLSPLRGLFDSVFPFLEQVAIIRVVLSSILVFFLPGFTWSLIFFNHLRIIERLVISIALSIVVVTLTILFTNILFDVPINGFNSVLIITVVTVLPLIGYYSNKLIQRRKRSDT
jgi:uncharacterized membrane protein